MHVIARKADVPDVTCLKRKIYLGALGRAANHHLAAAHGEGRAEVGFVPARTPSPLREDLQAPKGPDVGGEFGEKEDKFRPL